ncbi:hypothetical protein ACFLSA_06590 [Bacteroidota bacterium]
MTGTASKIILIVLYILMGISAVLILLFYAGGITPETQGSVYEEPVYTELILKWAYILFGIGAVGAIGFPIVGMITQPKGAIKAFISIGILAVLVLIAYSLASDELLDLINYDGPDNIPGRLKYAGTMLNTAFILAAAAVLSIVYSEIVNLFK